MKKSFAAFALLLPLRLLAADARCPDSDAAADLSKPALSVQAPGARKLIVCGYQ